MSTYPDQLHEHIPRVHTFERALHALYEYLLVMGEVREDRTGTGTYAVFGERLKIDLQAGFPLMTTKAVPFKAVLSELLWFVEGSGDERRLAEILHGTRDAEKRTIWTPNAAATSGSTFQPAYPGDLGRVYGVQWRTWRRFEPLVDHGDDNETHALPLFKEAAPLDQLAEVVHKLLNNPYDRRIILSAWNPGELREMALPPCHMLAQFYMSNDRRLSCQMHMRSVDTFLGLPFNIASYALLTHMLAHVVGATVGDLIITMGDTHIYTNHVEQVKELLTRQPYQLPELRITREITDIGDFRMEDFELTGYQHHAAIKAPMAA